MFKICLKCVKIDEFVKIFIKLLKFLLTTSSIMYSLLHCNYFKFYHLFCNMNWVAFSIVSLVLLSLFLPLLLSYYGLTKVSVDSIECKELECLRSLMFNGHVLENLQLLLQRYIKIRILSLRCNYGGFCCRKTCTFNLNINCLLVVLRLHFRWLSIYYWIII